MYGGVFFSFLADVALLGGAAAVKQHKTKAPQRDSEPSLTSMTANGGDEHPLWDIIDVTDVMFNRDSPLTIVQEQLEEGI